MALSENQNGLKPYLAAPLDLYLVPRLLVSAGLMALGIISQYSGLDEWIIRPFYDADTQTWPYKSSWFTDAFLHTGGKYFIVLVGIVLGFGLIGSFFREPLAKYRTDLIYLIIGTACGIIIVAILKSATHIYSPSKLADFGGTRPHIRLFDAVPPDAPIGHAFPSGHASGAFGLVSFYFLLSVYGSRWRYAALVFSVGLGFVYGTAQQARGKHFFSHDLFALAICWASALLVLYVMNRVVMRKSGGSS
jgi:membrane-associated PAP2 superfamily phosphatase